MDSNTTARLRQVRDRAANARARLSGSSRDLAAEVDRLGARVRVLEEEVQEARRLNRRLAELTDVVQELLLPLSQRDEEKARQVLQRYSTQL
ncbi:MAG TPA: DUF6752 domain-containing protein [Marmoricola sp.]|nr:DUF6752 domain-containing protein [Marmoricola sp.]